jgi:hypothetical protein
MALVSMLHMSSYQTALYVSGPGLFCSCFDHSGVLAPELFELMLLTFVQVAPGKAPLLARQLRSCATK